MQVEFRQIHKRFGEVHALRGIDMRIEGGSIHGLVGENGAGKSTLMKILTGYLSKSEGQILLDGSEVDCNDPQTAASLGIGMLYQEPQDFPPLSVLENFMVGSDSLGAHTHAESRMCIAELAARVDFNLQPESIVERLTVGERQQLEFLRLLGREVRVLILDEPTTGISEEQKARLFAALRQIRDEGRTIILVSHKLEEVEALCDRVTILRHGAVSGEAQAPFKADTLLAMMFDKPVEGGIKPVPRQPGNPVIRFDNVSATGERVGLHDCSLEIAEGELIGLAGLSGSGQGLFLRAAAGLLRSVEGQVSLQSTGKNYDHRRFRRHGGVFLPADRLHEGLIPGFTVQEHFALTTGGSTRAVHRLAEAAIARFNIRGRPETQVESLSGGNQQRLQLALIPGNARMVLLENPTRGLDVESGARVWRYLREQYVGAALVFSSAELEEILAVANRVLVFFEGRVVCDLSGDALDYDHIAAAMTGRVQ